MQNWETEFTNKFSRWKYSLWSAHRSTNYVQFTWRKQVSRHPAFELHPRLWEFHSLKCKVRVCSWLGIWWGEVHLSKKLCCSSLSNEKFPSITKAYKSSKNSFNRFLSIPLDSSRFLLILMGLHQRPRECWSRIHRNPPKSTETHPLIF